MAASIGKGKHGWRSDGGFGHPKSCMDPGLNGGLQDARGEVIKGSNHGGWYNDARVWASV